MRSTINSVQRDNNNYQIEQDKFQHQVSTLTHWNQTFNIETLNFHLKKIRPKQGREEIQSHTLHKTRLEPSLPLNPQIPVKKNEIKESPSQINFETHKWTPEKKFISAFSFHWVTLALILSCSLWLCIFFFSCWNGFRELKRECRIVTLGEERICSTEIIGGPQFFVARIYVQELLIHILIRTRIHSDGARKVHQGGLIWKKKFRGGVIVKNL